MDNMYDENRINRTITQSDTEMATETVAAPRTSRGLHRSISVEYGESLQAALDELQTDTKCLGRRNCCSWLINEIIDFFRGFFCSKEIIGPVMDESPKCSELVVETVLADAGHDQKGEAVQSESVQEYTTAESPLRPISDPVCLCIDSDDAASVDDFDADSELDSDSSSDIEDYREILRSGFAQPSLSDEF